MTSPQNSLLEPYLLLEETGAGYIAQPSGHDVFYDEPAGLLHIVEGRMVSAVPLPENSIAGQNTAAASALSPTPSLGPSLLTTPPRSNQGSLAVLSSPEKEEGQEQEEEKLSDSLALDLSRPAAPLTSIPHHRHQRTVSDVASIASTATTTTPCRAFLVSSGPPITAVCASLDGAFTALQRSKLQVEFIDHSNGNMFVEVPQNRGAGLHGFFWTDAVDAEFVLVTSMGLELYSPKVGSQGLKYTAFQRLSAVQWFLWSHSTRILVAGCGNSGAKLQAFQFSRHSGVVRLPMLDLSPPWGSPMKSYSQSQSAAAMRAAPWLLVSPTQVWVLLLYRRVFIAYHDISSSTLKLYRMYRDATALFAECPLTGKNEEVYKGGSKHIELSVVEDVIVVHCLEHSGRGGGSGGGNDSANDESGTALLIDIAGDGIIGPSGVRIIDPVVSKPTRLGVVLIHHQDREEEENEKDDDDDDEFEEEIDQQHKHSALEGILKTQHHQKLSLFYPDVALDQASGRIYRLKIDFVALSDACCSNDEVPALLSFLHRRQERRRNYSGPSSVLVDSPRRDPRYVILRVLRRMVSDRAEPASLRAAFDAVLATPSSRQRQHSIKKTFPSIGEEDHGDDDDYRGVHAKEIALGILAPALQSSQSPRTPTTKLQPTSAANYVVAALSELFSSCYATGNYPLHADIASLYLTAYSYAGKEYLLPSLLKCHAQLLDSPELAERLEAGEVVLVLESQNYQYKDKYSSIIGSSTSQSGLSNNGSSSTSQLLMQLALEMWRRLGNHKRVCNLLLKQGNVRAAVKHAQMFLHNEDLEDPDNVFNIAYRTISTTIGTDSTTSNPSGTSTVEVREESSSTAALKYALERFLQDMKKRRLTPSSASSHPLSSFSNRHRRQSSSVDHAPSSLEFLDQQTASLVEALENF